MLQPSTLTFLKSLKKNNNKPWFDKNREKYIAAKNNFEEFVTVLLQKMVLFDADMKELEAKNCTFRINRDIRFSKNKTPYKINISALSTREAKNQFMQVIIFIFNREEIVLSAEVFGCRNRRS